MIDEYNKISDNDPKIIIDAETRTLKPEEGFNNIIGVVEDYDAEEITFKCPKILEGYNVTESSYKIIKWHNIASDIMGSQQLTYENIPDEDDFFLLKWIVPKEACTEAGKIKIAIAFYDVKNNENAEEVIGYKWNSRIYTELEVAEGLNTENLERQNYVDQIININVYTRQFSVKRGFDTIVGYSGDSGLSEITFRINRYYKDIDFAGREITLYWTNANQESGRTTIKESKTVEGLSGIIEDSYLEFKWPIGNQIINYVGTISLFISILIPQDETNYVCWNSSIFDMLQVAQGPRTPAVIFDIVDYSIPVVDRDSLAVLLNKYYNYVMEE